MNTFNKIGIPAKGIGAIIKASQLCQRSEAVSKAVQLLTGVLVPSTHKHLDEYILNAENYGIYEGLAQWLYAEEKAKPAELVELALLVFNKAHNKSDFAKGLKGAPTVFGVFAFLGVSVDVATVLNPSDFSGTTLNLMYEYDGQRFFNDRAKDTTLPMCPTRLDIAKYLLSNDLAALQFLGEEKQSLSAMDRLTLIHKLGNAYEHGRVKPVKVLLNSVAKELAPAIYAHLVQGAKEGIYIHEDPKNRKYNRFLGKWANVSLGQCEKPVMLLHLAAHGFKCSLSTNHRTLTATVLEAPKEYKDDIKKLGRKVTSLLDDFNFDDSDTMTDYFHVKFYTHVNTEKIKFVANATNKPTKPAKEEQPKQEKTQEKTTAKEGEVFETTNAVSGETFSFEVREKCFILRGNTYPYKEDIKNAFGGVWNRTLAGWIIKIEQLENCKSIFC